MTVAPFENYIEKCQSNCALGKECRCAAYEVEAPWRCDNWGRSSLPAPAIIGRDPQYGGGGKKVERAKKVSRLDYEKQIGSMRRRNERFGTWYAESEKKLREIRHSDPRKHLRKKGVKI